MSDHDEQSTTRLGSVATANLTGLIIELIGCLLRRSIALISDAIQTLVDTTAYITAFIAAETAETKHEYESWTYDYHRLEALGLTNGYDFIPHYTEEHRDAVTDQIKLTGNPVMCSPEESGVHLQGDQATVIGEKHVVLRHGNREVRVQSRSTVGLRKIYYLAHRITVMYLRLI